MYICNVLKWVNHKILSKVSFKTHLTMSLKMAKLNGFYHFPQMVLSNLSVYKTSNCGLLDDFMLK